MTLNYYKLYEKMVATYVEIIFGIRLTDKEACNLLLEMTDEEYEKAKEDLGNTGVFVDCDNTDYYQFDSSSFSRLNINIFNCICCSDTTDIVVGVSLRKIYRIKIRCEKCSEYSLCNECFNT